MIKSIMLWVIGIFRRPQDTKEDVKVIEPPLVDTPTTIPSTADNISYTEEEENVMTPDVKRVIENIVGVFETGKVGGDYSMAVYLPDGAGITYGKHQAIDRSGSLDAIVQRYILLSGTKSEQLRPYMSMLENNGTVGHNPGSLPGNVEELMSILVQAGSDPIMHQAQDEIFDEWYWNPMATKARGMKLSLPLSWLAMYDSSIHSGPAGIDRTRNLFPEVPPSKGGDEKEWTTAYIKARRNWLATHKKKILHNTVYRMDTMLSLIHEGNWGLSVPIHIKKPRATIV